MARLIRDIIVKRNSGITAMQGKKQVGHKLPRNEFTNAKGQAQRKRSQNTGIFRKENQKVKVMALGMQLVERPLPIKTPVDVRLAAYLNHYKIGSGKIALWNTSKDARKSVKKGHISLIIPLMSSRHILNIMEFI